MMKNVYRKINGVFIGILISITGILIVSLLISQCTTFASVQSHRESDDGYTLEYPLVYVENKSAQDKINADIYRYVASFKKDFVHSYSKTPTRDGIRHASLNYHVKYEDDLLISIVFIHSRYMYAALHESFKNYGVVYDKGSGERIPLGYFFKITLNDLQGCYISRVYDWNDKPVEQSNTKDFAPRRLTEEYYLLGDGGIALLYNPNELSSWSSHATTIRFTKQDVDYYNQRK